MISLNGESLAYLGDSIYEAKIREHILSSGYQDVNKLHKLAVRFTSGESQAKIVEYLLKNEILSEEEIVYYKRGRNSSHSKNRRSISVGSYKMATGFESLIGYLYLSGKTDRMEELIQLVIKIVEEGLL